MTAFAVVVPNWNGMAVLPSCLEAVARQQTAPSEVVVVDNGSTDGSAEMAERDYGVRVLRQGHNRGFGAAANAGVSATTAPLVAVLNSDAAPDPHWLRNLAPVVAASAEDIWAWGSVQVRPDGTIESAGDCWAPTGAAYKLLSGRPITDLPSEPFEVFSPPGAAPVFRRSCFQRLGGYDESFFLYYEDLELSWRARWRGWRSVTVPNAHVRHELGASGDLSRTQRFSARNSLITTIRHHPALRWHTLAAHTAHEAAVAHRRGLLLPYLRGRASGVAALPAAVVERRRSRRSHVITSAELNRFLQSQGS